MRIERVWIAVLVALAFVISSVMAPLPLLAQNASTKNDATPFLQALLLAHRAWMIPPGSIRIQGISLRGNSRQPVTITANQKEETIIEYASARRVATPSSQFQEDDQKTAFANTPAAFDQLDITGIFLISQLTLRSVAAAPETLTTTSGSTSRIHLSSGRTQVHFRQLPVTDELDVFVGPSGLLTGIERTIYPGDSRLRYTLGYRFSDYRDTGGVLLPYRIETTFKGNTEETILVNNYQMNPPTTPSLLEPRPQFRRAR